MSCIFRNGKRYDNTNMVCRKCGKLYRVFPVFLLTLSCTRKQPTAPLKINTWQFPVKILGVASIVKPF
jgi:hypothetical protein